MRFGACTSFADAPLFAEAGFDFLELNVQLFLQGGEPDSAYATEWKKAQACPLPAQAANCLVPGNLKVTGPQADPEKLASYMAVVCRRAEQAGIRTLVFGSGAARQVPDGFPREEAWRQLLDFAKTAAQVAASHGIVLVVEPLNQSECNILNTVGESAEFVREAGHSHLQLLVDSYHWWRDDLDEKALIQAGGLLHHVHLATATNRLAPGSEAANFADFFALLREGGYCGPLSIEAIWKNPAAEAPAAFQILSTM